MFYTSTSNKYGKGTSIAQVSDGRSFWPLLLERSGRNVYKLLNYYYSKAIEGGDYGDCFT